MSDIDIMSSMDEILRRSLLFDFYGELLTDHQKKIYEAFDSEDLSLSEIAEQEGISRQGVHDSLKRALAALHNYEDTLHLVLRFLHIRELAAQAKEAEGAERSRLIDEIAACTMEF